MNFFLTIIILSDNIYQEISSMPIKIYNKYKKCGIKLTPQRLAIFDYLEGNTGPSFSR